MRLAAAALLLAPGCALLAAPEPPPGSASARRLAAEPYRVRSECFDLEDRARGRELPTTVWLPVGAAGPRPLVVYSHGFLSDRSGGAYLAQHLASRGYVVAAPTHPGTTLCASGGARVADVVRQPGDLSFVIDRLLADDGPLAGHARIDPGRIAATGLSLGGLTATLTAYHPRLRDPRIAAAVSIAGPMSIFAPEFFATPSIPFLMVAGSADVIVDYRDNAFVTVASVPDGTLVLIAGASHTGFDDSMTGLPRLLDNPDDLGCWLLEWSLDLDAAREDLPTLAQAGDGVTAEHGLPAPCTREPPPVAMDPARQHLITTLAVTSFLDSRFAGDADERAAAARYLAETLPRDFPEVSVVSPVPPAADAR